MSAEAWELHAKLEAYGRVDSTGRLMEFLELVVGEFERLQDRVAELENEKPADQDI